VVVFRAHRSTRGASQRPDAGKINPRAICRAWLNQDNRNHGRKQSGSPRRTEQARGVGSKERPKNKKAVVSRQLEWNTAFDSKLGETYKKKKKKKKRGCGHIARDSRGRSSSISCFEPKRKEATGKGERGPGGGNAFCWCIDSRCCTSKLTQKKGLYRVGTYGESEPGQ